MRPLFTFSAYSSHNNWRCWWYENIRWWNDNWRTDEICFVGVRRGRLRWWFNDVMIVVDGATDDCTDGWCWCWYYLQWFLFTWRRSFASYCITACIAIEFGIIAIQFYCTRTMYIIPPITYAHLLIEHCATGTEERHTMTAGQAPMPNLSTIERKDQWIYWPIKLYILLRYVTWHRVSMSA